MQNIENGSIGEGFFHSLGATEDGGSLFECAKCRYKLFNSSHVINHTPGESLESIFLRQSTNKR